MQIENEGETRLHPQTTEMCMLSVTLSNVLPPVADHKTFRFSS